MQLLSITHEIHKAFDDGNKIQAVFLDISKAFDTVWHEGLIFKLKRIGVEGDMINTGPSRIPSWSSPFSNIHKRLSRSS